MMASGRWRIGLSLVVLATGARLVWALAVPTIPVGDFATYRESAMQLAELGRLDHGFVYMPGWVVLLAAVHALGGGVLAAKLLGAVFGGLAAGPLYAIAAGLFDDRRTDGAVPLTVAAAPERAGWAGWSAEVKRAPAAFVTGLGYALWPAGIAHASVVGTDIPAASTMVSALALLVVWGPRRPWRAAAAFGAVMGLAAYFRAVALPLAALSAVYWLVQRAGTRATLLRTAVAIAMTVTVLVPWGLRNRRVNGEFFLTDSHGGITALMGNDPNTDGTYSRALGTMFQELTGRTFLTEPHRQTDRAAYRLARQWMSADPLWTAGLVAMRAERLFAPERGLLYWSLYRPGVLPRGAADWFNAHRRAFVGVTDWYYLLFVVCLCAGLGFAWGERRAAVLVPLSLAVALAGTYALFVGEPRYRLTSEVFLFPLAGFGAHRLATRGPRGDCRGWVGTGVALVSLVLLVVLVVQGGAALRERHRWAAMVWHVDGRSRLALFLPHAPDGAPSPVRGAAPGATLRLTDGQDVAEADIVVPEAALPGGAVSIAVDVEWPAGVPDGAELAVGPALAKRGVREAKGVFARAPDAAGALRLRARLAGPVAVGGAPVAATVTAVRITTGTAP